MTEGLIPIDVPSNFQTLGSIAKTRKLNYLRFFKWDTSKFRGPSELNQGTKVFFKMTVRDKINFTGVSLG